MVLHAASACGVRVDAEWLALSISGAWSGRGEGALGEGVGGSLLCGPVRKRAQFISSLVTGAAARYTHHLV